MAKHEPDYRWNNPVEWLYDRISNLDNANDLRGMVDIATALLSETDSDTVQELFQSEMDEDGYFEDLSLKHKFVMDLNERDRLGFHVERVHDDKVVFESWDDDARALIEDGFMQHAEDSEGLLEHLKSLGVVPQQAVLEED